MPCVLFSFSATLWWPVRTQDQLCGCTAQLLLPSLPLVLPSGRLERACHALPVPNPRHETREGGCVQDKMTSTTPKKWCVEQSMLPPDSHPHPCLYPDRIPISRRRRRRRQLDVLRRPRQCPIRSAKPPRSEMPANVLRARPPTTLPHGSFAVTTAPNRLSHDEALDARRERGGDTPG